VQPRGLGHPSIGRDHYDAQAHRGGEYSARRLCARGAWPGRGKKFATAIGAARLKSCAFEWFGPVETSERSRSTTRAISSDSWGGTRRVAIAWISGPTSMASPCTSPVIRAAEPSLPL